MNNAIAETILAQLGGMSRVSAMIGIKSAVASETMLNLKFKARAKNRANCVTIELASDDTYTVRFYAIKSFDVRPVSEREGVYADSLRSLFERETGLYLSL